jgi:hypothetical protein
MAGRAFQRAFTQPVSLVEIERYQNIFMAVCTKATRRAGTFQPA